jgi:hypothetical protein
LKPFPSWASPEEINSPRLLVVHFIQPSNNLKFQIKQQHYHKERHQPQGLLELGASDGDVNMTVVI